MSTEDKLKIAIDGLERIKWGESGPAHHAADETLKRIKEDEQTPEKRREAVVEAAKCGYYGEKQP